MKAIASFLLLVGTAALADTPRNVVLFIGDGMSTPQRIVAEEFSRKVYGGGYRVRHDCHSKLPQ